MTSDEIETMWCRCEGQGLPGVVAFAEQVAQQAIAEALISVSHAVAEEREACAKAVEPTKPRACLCDQCDCGNQGNAEDVAAWDAQKWAADTIRLRSNA